MTMTPWNLPHGQWSKWLFCDLISCSYLTFVIKDRPGSLFQPGPGPGPGSAKSAGTGILPGPGL